MYCEDFEVGQHFTLQPVRFEIDDIMHFASRYDPQPIHIDKEFADQGLFKGIIASGVHTLSVIWSEWIQTGRFGTEIIGGRGLDFVTWNVPVRPGDTLHTDVEVVEANTSPGKGRGLLVIKFTAANQDGATVLTTQARVYLKSQL
jgi:acyl dehydratase